MVLSKLETSNSTFYYRDHVDVAHMNEFCTESISAMSVFTFVATQMDVNSIY